MKVAVASKNPVKLEAVRRAFSKFFKDVEVFGVEFKGVAQPFNEETVMLAIERAKRAFEAGADYGVGIEAGLFSNRYAKTGYLDVQYVAIYDGKEISIGCGPGFEHPPQIIRRVLEGVEVGKAFEEISGIENIGRKMGAIGYLSGGVVSRADITEQAVIMALIPRVSKLFGNP